SVNLPATGGGGLFIRDGVATPTVQIDFAAAMADVPVVIVMPSNQGADPRSLRVRNITTSGFEVAAVSAPDADGSGPPMSVHYFAMLPGSYRLPVSGGGTGPLVKVGSWETSTIQYNPAAFPNNVNAQDNDGNDIGGCAAPGQQPAPGFDAITFPLGENFASSPVLLASVQTWNNEGANLNGGLTGPSAPFMNVALQDIDTTGFDGAIELSEVRRNVPCGGLASDETIGYVAIEDGVDVILEVYGGGDEIMLVTGIGTAHRGEFGEPPTWDTNHCAANDLSTTHTFVETNLRGFAALRSRAEDDGGWLRRCALSSPAAGEVRIELRIDEDTNFDSERRQTPVPGTAAEIRHEPVSFAIFGGDFVTTPVSLAWMRVKPLEPDQLQVAWATATEVGHVGFELQGRSTGGSWRRLGDLVPGRGLGELGADDYEVLVQDASTINEVRLVDIDQLGHRRFHPIVAVGSDMGRRPDVVLTDWDAIRAANLLTAPAINRAAGNQQAVARVAQKGIQRLDHAALLATGIDFTGVPAEAMAITTAGEPVARYIGGGEIWNANSYIEWLGQASESIYSASRAYLIIVDPAAARPVPAGTVPTRGDSPRVERHIKRFERKRRYSISAPSEDPWYDARLATSGNPVTVNRSFELPARVAGSVSMEVEVWGGLDFPGTDPDHHVEVLLNGVLVASRRFDGLVVELIQFEVDEDLLVDNNVLTIRLPGDTGYASDVVQFVGFSVDYPRMSAFSGDHGEGGPPLALDGLFHSRFQATVSEPDALGFTVAGVSSPAVIWFDEGHGLRRIVYQGQDVRLPESATAWLGSYIDAIAQPAVEPAVEPAVPVDADYLIIAHPQFADHLDGLISLQQSRGLSVALARTDQIYAGFGAHEPYPQAIADFISVQGNARFVLLVGGDHVDYRGYMGNEAQSFLPTFYRQADAIVRHAPDELRFVDRNGDGQPDASIGRLPVRTVDELQRLVAAIVERDAAGPASSVMVASGGSAKSWERFGHDARVLASIGLPGWSYSFAAVDELGTAEARSVLRQGLEGEAQWLSYIGHSAPGLWGFEPLLRQSDLAGIDRTGPPAVVTQWGCWNNWFVSPTQDAILHGLMLGEQVKAATVLGSVSLAEDASHFALATRFYSLRAFGGLDGQSGSINTFGEALLEAQRDVMLNDPAHRGAAYSVVLFGDPAQPLR
ncbi:MAG: hypothetical protein EA370_12535, partial [Wenzhouxiangella sp.]